MSIILLFWKHLRILDLPFCFIPTKTKQIKLKGTEIEKENFTRMHSSIQKLALDIIVTASLFNIILTNSCVTFLLVILVGAILIVYLT